MPAGAPSTLDFGPISVEYDARVIATRPWTLAQSEWAAELVRERSAGRLLELCAGAGHIGLAAAVLADCDLVQVELDPVAAGYADANARRAGRAGRVEVRVAPLQSAVHADETFPVIVADPPYLPSRDVDRWPDDPVLAIDGGTDGLDIVRACLQVAAEHLGPGGSLVLQVAGRQQAEQVERLLEAAPDRSLRAVDLRETDAERAVMRIDR